jgi:hypothetical protein
MRGEDLWADYLVAPGPAPVSIRTSEFGGLGGGRGKLRGGGGQVNGASELTTWSHLDQHQPSSEFGGGFVGGAGGGAASCLRRLSRQS